MSLDRQDAVCERIKFGHAVASRSNVWSSKHQAGCEGFSDFAGAQSARAVASNLCVSPMRIGAEKNETVG